MDLRIGNGFDVHRLEHGLPMWLGGIRLDHHSGFVAHSDGDVLIHSLCDALLGAIGKGDIGTHFPDSDPEYKGIDSKELLRRTMKLVRDAEYELINCDNTIIAEAPKINPHISSMREALSAVMGVDPERISIKASTSEKLGYIGRQEGIAVLSTVLIHRG